MHTGALTAEEEPPLVVERNGGQYWLWLNRPARRNALDDRLVTAFDAAITGATADPAAKVIIIAGRGRSFCAGADLTHLLAIADREDGPADFIASVSACLLRLERCPLPTIAALHGHAVAGGLEIALACDVVVAERGTLIGDGHMRNRLIPGGGSSVRLPRRVGHGLARWLLLTGELLPAEEFLPSGWPRAVVAADHLYTEAASLAARLSAASGSAQLRLKALLNDIEGRAPSAALRAESRAFAEHWAADDVPSALRDFLASRGKPRIL